MADLYVDSQQEREYPVQIGDKVARNSSEYMALSTQVLKKGLINKSPGVLDMLKAIQEGKYDVYSQSIMPESRHKKSRKLSKQLSQYQN